MKKRSAIFSIVLGCCMIGMWVVFYLNNSIPEIEIKLLEFSMHIVAEMITALCLILSGIGLLTKKSWADPLYLFSSGMLVYTVITSAGYFLQRNEIPFVIMFVVILILTLVFLKPFIQKEN